MTKRLTKKEKEEIVKSFTNGISIEDLSLEFQCTKLTISRNLKISIGEQKYKEIIKDKKITVQKNLLKKENTQIKNKNNFDLNNVHANNTDEHFNSEPFIEITPLNYDIDNSIQKDFSSVPISEIKFPNIVYMIVDNKTELVIKYLEDYPDWQFLSKEELGRKTIEIHLDLKTAKRICNKDQKVIKVPNTKVFEIVAPLLLSRGISRIVSSNNLIAL